jgi:hypothetical protein
MKYLKNVLSAAITIGVLLGVGYIYCKVNHTTPLKELALFSFSILFLLIWWILGIGIYFSCVMAMVYFKIELENPENTKVNLLFFSAFVSFLAALGICFCLK